MPRSRIDITGADVPQAPNLARIRCVVASIAGGAATIEQIAEETDISARHIGYAVRAAQILDLLGADRQPTAAGRALLETDQESADEREAFKEGIAKSPILKAIAPTLLGPKAPTKQALGARIEKLSGLSKATALHRASDLRAWREQLIDDVEGDAAPDASSAAADSSEG
jgi:hypothetical protein